MINIITVDNKNVKYIEKLASNIDLVIEDWSSVEIEFPTKFDQTN